LSQTVNIFGCKDSVIQIKGKVNAISMVSCRKTSVLLDSTVSALSVTGSPSFTVQILGKVPTILIDSTDGGQIYLSQESLDVELITSKTSGLNVSVPKPREKDQDYDEYTELPIPEQMKTVVSGTNKLKTEIVEHSG
jgi:adenylyl cyclase-associated protein